MTISNPASGRKMGWIWVDPIKPSTPASFRWGITNPPLNFGNLPAQGSLLPGQANTLYISLRQSCGNSTTTYSVIMVDTYNRSYPVSFTPKYP
jgi:hypothetical protein